MEKEGTFEPSRDQGWPKEARRTRRRGRASGASEPRNLRHGQAVEPPAYRRRRFDVRAEDSSVRRVEARPGRGAREELVV